MFRWKTTFCGCLGVMLLVGISSAASLEDFVKSINQNDQLDEQARQDVLELIDQMKTDEESASDIVSEALLTMYPDFDEALEALGEEEVEPAVKGLQALAESKDEYLAAEAKYYLGRAHMMIEHYEKSLPTLTELLDKHAETTFRTAEAVFFKGMSEAHLLKRKEAIKTLDHFLLDFDDTPERMQMAAWHNLEMMKAIEDGALSDIQDRMEYSRRRLALAESGERTQEEQDNIVAMLDKLIEEAEQREQSGGT